MQEDQANFATHYAIRKHHMHIALALLLIAAVAVGWEFHTILTPVQLPFCADVAK